MLYVSVPFAFDDPAVNSMPYFTQQEVVLAQQMADMWGALATTGMVAR